MRDPPAASIDRKLCPQLNTVTSLWNLLCTCRVIHCGGTPTSGKTCPARSLERYATSTVLTWKSFTSWPGNAGHWITDSLNVLLKKVSDKRNRNRPILDCSNLSITCGEAQNSYAFFWNDLVKFQSQGAASALYIALFSSCGSPGGDPVTYDGSAPPFLSPEQQVTYPSTLSTSHARSLRTLSIVCVMLRSCNPSQSSLVRVRLTICSR
jgi:hypothetical protein